MTVPGGCAVVGRRLRAFSSRRTVSGSTKNEVLVLKKNQRRGFRSPALAVGKVGAGVGKADFGMKIRLEDVPMGRSIQELEGDDIAAELDQELAQKLGITVEELNREPTPEELEAIGRDPARVGLAVRMASAARAVGKSYAAKHNADA